MALNNLGLGIVFTATDLASSVMNRVSTSFFGLDDTVDRVSQNITNKMGVSVELLTGQLKRLALGLGIATIGIAGIATAFKLAAPAGKFEQGLAAVGAVTRATTEEMRLLEQAAIDAGVATQFSPTEAVEGLTSLATAGQTAREATKTLIPVLDLAAGSMGKLGVAGAADAVVGTLNSYQLSVDKATQVTDKLLRITQLTNFQANDFQVGLSKAAAAGSQFGQSLDDVLITVGLLRNANIDASSAATAFREATRRVVTEQRVQNKLLAQGVAVADAQTGKIRPLIEIMQDLVERTKGQTEAQRAMIAGQIFGARGILAFNAVARAQAKVTRDGRTVTLQGAEAIEELRRKMSAAGGTAAEFRDKLLDTFEGQKTLLQGTLQTIAIAIGQPFAKVLKPIVGGIVDFMNTLLRVFLAIPEPIKRFIASVVVIGSIATAIVGAVIAGKALIAILGLLGVALSPMLILFGKIVLVIGAVVGAVLLLRRVWQSNFLGIRDIAMRVISPIVLAMRGLFALFRSGEISGSLARDLLKAENAGVLRFLKVIFKVASVARAVFVGVGQGISDVFTQLNKDLGPALKDFFSVGFDLAKEVIGLFLDIAEAMGFNVKSNKEGIQTISDLARGLIGLVRGPLALMAVSLRGTLFIVRGIVAQLRDGIALARSFASVVGVGTPITSAGAAGGGGEEGEGSATAPSSAPTPTIPSVISSTSPTAGILGAIRAGIRLGIEGASRISGGGEQRDLRGTVLLDGREVGELRMQQEQDDRARKGEPRSVMGS